MAVKRGTHSRAAIRKTRHRHSKSGLTFHFFNFKQLHNLIVGERVHFVGDTGIIELLEKWIYLVGYTSITQLSEEICALVGCIIHVKMISV